MTTLREAAQQALDFVEFHSKYWNGSGEHPQKIVSDLRQTLEVEQMAEPAAQPFNTWSSNEGDSWYDDPADAQIIEDAFGGDMPVIGDEYEVLAGWRCVTARYRITFVSGDGDCEVDCVSHPHQQPAQCIGLTDEQIDSCFPVQWEGEFYKPWRKAVARAIEAKLREKNGGAA